MGWGKQWTDAETKAVIAAFIHISEDAITGTNQSSDHLYDRVAQEAKKRFTGEWMRPPESCKKRWQDVSREVQKFCAAMKLVESVEHSGWNDDDYFKAAEEYYCARSGQNVIKFKFINEWKYLKQFKKWKTLTSPPLKRSSDHQLSLSESSDSDCQPTPHPSGNKKQKALAALESKAGEWMSRLANGLNSNDSNKAMLDIMKENLEQSKKNREFLQDILQAQTSQLTAQLEKNATQMQKKVALKALSKLDLNTMSLSFQEKAKKKLEEELGSILNF